MVLLKVVADILIELSKIHRLLFTLIYKLSYPISPTRIIRKATTCHYSPTRVVDNLRNGKNLGMRAMLLGTLRTTSFLIFLKAAAEELRCLTNLPIPAVKVEIFACLAIVVAKINFGGLWVLTDLVLHLLQSNQCLAS